MTNDETIKLVVDGLGAILVPIVLLGLGQWFLRIKDRSDRARQDAIQLATFIEHLSSESKERRKLALLALNHMRHANLFPQILFESVQIIAARDDPEVAAYAQLALGVTNPLQQLTPRDRTLLLEVLLPVKVHFERSRLAFTHWVEHPPNKPNLEIEDAIRASNAVVSSLLRSKWLLIPEDLQDDARRLLEHYDAWLAEYHRLRPNGVRDPSVPYVFVGPQGFPFPRDAEQHFLDRYAELASDSETPPGAGDKGAIAED